MTNEEEGVCILRLRFFVLFFNLSPAAFEKNVSKFSIKAPTIRGREKKRKGRKGGGGRWEKTWE